VQGFGASFSTSVRQGFSLLQEVAARPYVAARLRLLAICMLGLLLLQLLRGDILAQGFEPLPAAARRHGLSVSAASARSLPGQRRGRAPQTVVFRAHEPNNLNDVWVGEAVLSRDGRVAALSHLHNLTRTSSADESEPLVNGRWVLCARSLEGQFVGLELLDLAAEPASERGALATLQRGISNLQHTGRFSGVGKRSYTFKAPVKRVQLAHERGRFVIDLEGALAVIDPAFEQPVEGSGLLEVHARPTAVADLVPWLVDTARAISWIGPERIAWLENKVFALRDSGIQAYHRVSVVDHAKEAAKELGIAADTPKAEEERVERLSIPDPESGWPPPPIAPLITPEIPSEGKWLAIVDDPDARQLPGGRPIFYQSFVRADAERSWARVYLTLWDPRLVQLNIVAGTQEPVSATGETGGGTIPRTKQVLSRLVGAFNGGFQAMHGEFGMMADARVYLPPKPWAATIAVFDDGRVGMGSWPGPSDRRVAYDEARAVAEIPAGMIAYRQNLTSLVEDGRFNPWGRWWWGAAPQQKSEQTLTQRSALCLTREGFFVYAWGDSASPEALGAALVAARCVRAMHLDMNAGHSGFEFYNVLAPDEPRPEVAQAPFRYEGSLPQLPGFTIRARKGVTSMGMPVPRYIHPDPRDYFYLTLKHGIETTQLPRDMPKMSSADLPHAGLPPAFARHVEPEARLLRIDPNRAPPQTEATPGVQLVLAELRGTRAPAALDDVALFTTRMPLGLRYGLGVPPADATVLLSGPALDKVPDASSALGVDEHGLLAYAESDGKTPGQVAALLARAGAHAAIALPAGTRLGLRFQEGVLAADGSSRLPEGEVVLTFVAQTVPAVEVLFPETTPLPYARWAGLQDQRVRYFRTSAPTSKAPANAFTEGSP
jgi:hypothetical protein